MKTRTLGQLAQEVLQAQDACNLSGLIHDWSRSMTELREVLKDDPNFGTDMINFHPISILWATKVADLVGYCITDYDKFSKALKECKELAVAEGYEGKL